MTSSAAKEPYPSTDQEGADVSSTDSDDLSERSGRVSSQEAALLWAACPVCDLTYSEELPVVDGGYRREQLSRMILDDLGKFVRNHKDQAHDFLPIVCGIEGGASVRVSL